MRISDWSSDVCSSDLVIEAGRPDRAQGDVAPAAVWIEAEDRARDALLPRLVGIIARLSLDRPVADIGRGHRTQRRMNGPARARPHAPAKSTAQPQPTGRASCMESECTSVYNSGVD